MEYSFPSSSCQTVRICGLSVKNSVLTYGASDLKKVGIPLMKMSLKMKSAQAMMV